MSLLPPQKTLSNGGHQEQNVLTPLVFSGVQPTGALHLGNYLGSIVNWLNFQENHTCFFGVMNLHAITIAQDPQYLRNSIFTTIATYLACGLDANKITIFLQSDVPQHCELTWLLGTITPIGWLNRMTQFKEKKDKLGNNGANSENLGLFSYPVLMAADILLYNANFVPVGEDQKQHLELTRDLALAFNRNFKNNFFNLPEPLIFANSKRIMSLQDGTKKMSKSDPSDLSRINLTDSCDQILKKITKAKTDSHGTISRYISKNGLLELRPEIANLINIFAAISNNSVEAIEEEYCNKNYSTFKQDLAQILIEKLKPIQENIKNLQADRGFLASILQNGKQKAAEIAQNNLNKIYSITGLK